MLRWHRAIDDEDREVAVSVPVAYSIRRLPRSDRWVLLVAHSYRIKGSLSGSFHTTRADAEQAAERIAERHAEKVQG